MASKIRNNVVELNKIQYIDGNNRINFTTDVYSNGSPIADATAGSYANSAFLQANAAFSSANNVAPQIQPAFSTANSAALYANGAFIKANAAYAFANTTTAWGTRQAFVATAGQTAFSPGSGYLPGYIDVYYNGLKLYGGDDYTATDGVNVTLSSAAAVNDIIEVVGFGANVPAANIYVLNSMASLLNRQTFYANSGQTIFTPSLSYRVGYVDVYYNGIKMNIPEDVTANNGSSINFITVTPTVNSIIEIVGLTPNVALANAIPITGGTISGVAITTSTVNTFTIGSNSTGTKVVSTGTPSGGADGDIWYRY